MEDEAFVRMNFSSFMKLWFIEAMDTVFTVLFDDAFWTFR